MKKQALDTEVGGNHYKEYAIEPVELAVACNWDFIQGNIAKYLLRAKYKNGMEDMEKARHYIEIALSLCPTEHKITEHKAIIKIFAKINKIAPIMERFLRAIDQKNYIFLKEKLTEKQIVLKFLS